MSNRGTYRRRDQQGPTVVVLTAPPPGVGWTRAERIAFASFFVAVIGQVIAFLNLLFTPQKAAEPPPKPEPQPKKRLHHDTGKHKKPPAEYAEPPVIQRNRFRKSNIGTIDVGKIRTNLCCLKIDIGTIALGPILVPEVMIPNVQPRPIGPITLHGGKKYFRRPDFKGFLTTPELEALFARAGKFQIK
jgi:hypothetical protein